MRPPADIPKPAAFSGINQAKMGDSNALLNHAGSERCRGAGKLFRLPNGGRTEITAGSGIVPYCDVLGSFL